MKKFLTLLLAAALSALTLAGCGNTAKTNETGEKNNIVYAKGMGPYTELFETAIIPILEKQGYTFTCVELELNEADAALTSGEADVSVEQHSAFMDAYNSQAGGNLVALGRIPTVPASVFSETHSSTDEIGEGMSIAVPQDAGNQARAFVMMQDLGWITLSEDADYATASSQDVAENPYNLKFIELQSTNIPSTLSDFDYGIITGSIVYFTGVDPSTALFNENLSDSFWLQVVVNADNEDAKWAQDIVAAYQSEEFLSWIRENNPSLYKNLWSIPDYD